MTLIKKILWLLFGLLIITNISYYTWHKYFAVDLSQPTIEVFAVSNIKLLSEVSENLIEIKPQTTSEQTCLFLGEFSNEHLAQNLKQRLLSFDINAEIIELEQNNSSVDYLVYLAPSGSEQIAIRELQNLRTKNIEGYIINNGELMYGISLGIFPNRSSAEVQLQKLRDAGYSPRLNEQTRTDNTFWLQIDQNRRNLLDNTIFNQLSHDFNQLNQRFMPCK